MKLISVATIVSVAFLLMSCAQSRVAKDLDSKFHTEPRVAGSQELQFDVDVLIANSSLQPEQKTQLRELQVETSVKLQALRQESLKMRSILIKDMFSSGYNKPEVKLLKKKIRNLEGQQVTLIFSTIDKANVIFGRAPNMEENERLMNRLLLRHASD